MSYKYMIIILSNFETLVYCAEIKWYNVWKYLYKVGVPFLFLKLLHFILNPHHP